MKTKLSYVEGTMDICGIGESQLTMGGISTLHVKARKILTTEIVKDGLFRAIAKNSRLSIIIENGYAVDQAPTLDSLKPRYEIEFIDKPLSLKDLEMHTEYTINITFDKSTLAWETKIMIYEIPKKKFEYLVYLRIGMLHTLSDGHGMVMIAKQFVEGLHEALKASKPLDLRTPVSQHSPPIQQLHAIADSRFVPYSSLFLLIFIWRFLIGLWMVLMNGLCYLIPYSTFSGTLDPSHDLIQGKPQQKMTRIKLFELDEVWVDQLRKNAKNFQGSIASLLTASGLAAYATVMEQYSTPARFYNISIVVNSRALITDPNDIPNVHGSATVPLNIEMHQMQDKDLFWSQVKSIKAKLNFMMFYLSPFCRVANLIPLLLTRFLYGQATPNKKRNGALLLSNVGAFTSADLNWVPNIQVIDIIGSANSYWTGNRSLFQITSITINGKMKLAIVYPTNMITEKDFELYCTCLMDILEKAGEQRDVLVGDIRAPNVPMQELQDSKDENSQTQGQSRNRKRLNGKSSKIH